MLSMLNMYMVNGPAVLESVRMKESKCKVILPKSVSMTSTPLVSVAAEVSRLLATTILRESDAAGRNNEYSDKVFFTVDPQIPVKDLLFSPVSFQMDFSMARTSSSVRLTCVESALIEVDGVRNPDGI